MFYRLFNVNSEISKQSCFQQDAAGKLLKLKLKIKAETLTKL